MIDASIRMISKRTDLENLANSELQHGPHIRNPILNLAHSKACYSMPDNVLPFLLAVMDIDPSITEHV